MNLPTMLGDIIRSLFSKPATGDFVDPQDQQELRGQLHWDPSQCVGCGLCIQDCPANAIELITIDKANKQFVMRYDAGRCTFCSQCIHSCRFNCFTLSNTEWSLSATDKAPFIIYYGEDDNVEQALESATSAVETEP